MRTFKLTDHCTLSGIRLLPEDRRVDGGGYYRPDCPDRLVPGHWFVNVPVREFRRIRSNQRLIPPV